MQTIMGANGQIGRELAIALKRDYTQSIRLVSRHPQKIHDTDEVFPADLLDSEQTKAAVAGSSIVYLTAGLPMNPTLWASSWPVIMRNVIQACITHKASLVFFDNTYMYPQTASPLVESTPFRPIGVMGRVRAEIASMLLAAMQQEQINAVICRAPEFYGPGKTQSITNSAVIDNLLKGKRATVLLRDDVKRSLIYTPDASRAMALIGNTPDAYGQTWHLPCDDHRLTYSEFIALAADVFGTSPHYRVVTSFQLRLASWFDKRYRYMRELLPRYQTDNVFVSDKFKARFPDFRVTEWRLGLANIMSERQKERA
ncbi:NAD-dependent epimerase [Salinivibrio siamensis]|uniref:NAD-dependent epimerase n=1 Tax=Salinivibrio siamensis TaxID=414286 RepID=A0ABX3KDV3_9GAMM|nr:MULTISPECIES: NAD-dependent epimerase/dehydratase family protein [Salinivibrio]OOE76929.1 NAD-dependent epimerase [Salinivibrio sp. ML290]OOE87148.1 NAD-dependent epimerase [Salinivibrio siamensis]